MNFKIEVPNLRFPNARTRRTRTEAIVLHHLDAHWDVNRTHAHHLSLGWNGIGYNFHVSMDGRISEGRGMEFQGAHTGAPAGTNASTIGIGCVGRYDSVDRSMPDVQFNALVWLIQHIHAHYRRALPIRGHRDFMPTACPGRHFPLQELQSLTFRADFTPKENERGRDMEKRFQTLRDIPDWAQPYIKQLTQTNAADGLPILRGDASGNLDLSLDMLRILVLTERRREVE